MLVSPPVVLLWKATTPRTTYPGFSGLHPSSSSPQHQDTQDWRCGGR